MDPKHLQIRPTKAPPQRTRIVPPPESAQLAVQSWAIRGVFEFRALQATKLRREVVCKGTNCSLRIYATPTHFAKRIAMQLSLPINISELSAMTQALYLPTFSLKPAKVADVLSDDEVELEEDDDDEEEEEGRRLPLTSVVSQVD